MTEILNCAQRMASIILPIILLLLAFAIKMTVNRPVDIPRLLQSVIELPADVMFLASSLIIGAILSKKVDTGGGLMVFIIYLLVTFLVVICWRQSDDQIIKKSWNAMWISSIGYILSSACLVISIFLNMGAK